MGHLTADQRRLPPERPDTDRRQAWQTVLDNKGLVLKTVDRIVRRITGGQYVYGLSPDEVFDEAVGAGYEGCLRAVESFDPDRGYKFSSYAVPVIRNAVFDSLDTLFSLQGAALVRHGSDAVTFVPLKDVDRECDPGLGWEEAVEQRVDETSRETDVHRFVDSLPKEQTAVVEAIADGLPYNVVAERLGMSRTRVAYLLGQARRHAKADFLVAA